VKAVKYTPDKRTVKEGIDRWLEVQRALKASSTVINYVSKAVHVEKKFGKRRIVDISKSDIELFQAQLLKQGLAPKTVNDIFTVVRGVWADAFGDGILKPDQQRWIGRRPGACRPLQSYRDRAVRQSGS